MITLRPCQIELVDGLRASIASGKRAPIAVASTGFGKTVVFSHMVQSAAAKGGKSLIIAHRHELLHQAADKLVQLGVPFSYIMPGNPYRPNADTHLASIQTIVRREKDVDYSIILVDEAHLSAAPSFKQVLSRYPNAIVLGFTATPCRSDGKGLGKSEGGLFDDMVEAISMKELIRLGYLSPILPYAPPTEIDLSGVRTKYGDYDLTQLEAAVDKPKITGSVVKHVKKLCGGKPGIVFCVSVKHAKDVAAQFNAEGLRARSLCGEDSHAYRQEVFQMVRDGKLDAITNNSLLVEGIDLPILSYVAMLCPTKSLVRYMQSAGRGMRPYPGKEHMILLDHVGNIARHGLPDADREWSLEGRKFKPPANRNCATCYRIFAAGTKRADVACAESPCGLEREADDSERASMPEVVDGELVAVVEAPPPAWAEGIRLTAVGGEFDKLVRLTNGRFDRLNEIRLAKSYRSGWNFVMAKKFKNGVWHGE